MYLPLKTKDLKPENFNLIGLEVFQNASLTTTYKPLVCLPKP